MDGVAIVLERMRMLIKQVKAEMPRHTTQQQVARRLGISDSMLSKIENEASPKSQLRGDTIASVLEAMELRADFLFDPDLGGATDYHQWRRKPPPPSAEPPHWAEFAKQWPRFGELRDTEIGWLKAMIPARETVRHWSDWIPLAEWLLLHRKKR